MDRRARLARCREGPDNALSIDVDGVEWARLDLQKERRVRFDIKAGAELIEVSARDASGKFPLASLLIPFDPTNGRQLPLATDLAVCDGAQRVSFKVSPRQGHTDEAAGAEVEIGFYED